MGVCASAFLVCGHRVARGKAAFMIDINNITFTYDGTHAVLDNVSAHIAPGEFVCILGGNGSGKSTLAKHVNALLLPDEGSVTVGGESTANEDEPVSHSLECGHGVSEP